MFMAMGGKLTLSDDSHGVSQVGLNFGAVSKYLKRLGVKDLYYLERQGQDSEAQSKLRLLVKKVPFAGLDDASFPSSVLP
jgi:histidinol-phosphatase (PHP family)